LERGVAACKGGNAMTSPIKYHGGKRYLAERIIALMPPRAKNPNAPATDDPGYLHYCEPYFGSGAVLFANDPEGISECINDLNGGLMNFWRVLQRPEYFERFRRYMEATPFSERGWKESFHKGTYDDADPVNRAATFFIQCRQSLAGRMDSFAPLSKTRTRRGMNEQASAWLSAVEGLPAIHERLKRVVVLGPKDALEVILQQDGPRTLFYCDPPYMADARVSTDVYQHEMSKVQHVDLLAMLGGIEGRFLLSGYRNELYDDYARDIGWNRHDIEISNHAAGGGKKRRMVELVWCNF